MKSFLPKSFSGRISVEIFITCMLGFTILTVFHLIYAYQNKRDSTHNALTHQITNLTADFQTRIDSLRRDTQFLASVPAISGIIRATQAEGMDAIDHSTLAQWKNRLAEIFKEMLIANPEYMQIRFIGLAHKGREIVRVDMNERRLSRTPELKLQSKAQEAYFQEAMQSQLGKVYLSEFSLNREWGKVVSPPQLVLRAAVPIADERNHVFGFVIINMLAEEALAALLELHKTGEISGIFNSKLDPLVSSSKANGWILAPNSQTAHDKVKKLFQQASREHPIVSGDFQNNLLIGKKIFYDPLKPRSFLGITISTDKKLIYAEVWSELVNQVLIILVFIAFSMVGLVLSLRRQTRPLQDLRKLANDLSKGERLPRPQVLEQKDDELSSLTRAFYDMAEEIQEKTVILNFQKVALDETALVSETDAKGRITYANQKFADITGYSVEELRGSDHRIINSGYHSKGFFTNLWKTIAQGKGWRGEVKNKRKDGSYYWVDSSIVPFTDDKGKILKYVSIRFDITEKKEQEEKLKELTKAKSKFLAIMSHEIRTPLGAVIGLAELLASTKLTHEQQDYVNNIGQSADMLLNILNDILDLSKLDSGKIDLNPEPTNLRIVGENVVRIFKEKALEKNVSLQLQVTDDFPQALSLDAVRFKQVLLNLISNAVKFTEQGEIHVHLGYAHAQEKLILEVKDTGIGMTESQCQRVFNEFEQAEDGTSKRYGGTGLGLPICQKIVAMMQGQITLSSVYGRGSSFLIEIPSVPCQAMQEQTLNKDLQPITEMLPQISTLLAEDYQLNQTIFKKMFDDYGLDVKAVENGLDAVEAFEQRSYDLVFLDIQMPVMDGVEACRRIRSSTDKKQPWIIALTANTFQDDIDRYQRAGFDDFVTKPFNRRRLHEALMAFAEKKGRFHTDDHDNNSPNFRPWIIVELIDDCLEAVGNPEETLLPQLTSGIAAGLKQLRDNSTNRNDNEIAEACHALRGICLNFGMERASYLLQRMEDLAKDHQPTEHLLTEVEETLTQSEKKLRKYIEQNHK